MKWLLYIAAVIGVNLALLVAVNRVFAAILAAL